MVDFRRNYLKKGPHEESNFLKTLGFQSTLATVDRIAESTKELYPEYFSKYKTSLEAGTKTWEEVRNATSYRMTFEQAYDLAEQKALGATSINTAARAGFFATSSRILSYGGLVATGLEIGVGGYKIWNAPGGERLKVGVEQAGEIGLDMVAALQVWLL